LPFIEAAPAAIPPYQPVVETTSQNHSFHTDLDSDKLRRNGISNDFTVQLNIIYGILLGGESRHWSYCIYHFWL